MKITHCYSMLLAMSFTAYTNAEPKKQEQVPDMAFFEYLADMVEIDGELLGPLDIKPVELSTLPKTANKKVTLELSQNDKIKTDIKKEKVNTLEDKNND